MYTVYKEKLSYSNTEQAVCYINHPLGRRDEVGGGEEKCPCGRIGSELQRGTRRPGYGPFQYLKTHNIIALLHQLFSLPITCDIIRKYIYHKP